MTHRTLVFASALGLAFAAAGQEGPAPVQAPAPRPPARPFDLLELHVEGATRLTGLELEAILTPFVGLGKDLADVERARQALEKAYSDRGFQTVSVAVPPQRVHDGVVTLKVTEGKVARLRVRGARYFAPGDIRRLAPSVAEGEVPNFNAIVVDLVNLNGLPDRRVTPTLQAGALPGTIDVDLNVQDKLPLHGNVELNNRYSATTTRQRLNLSVRYENLWQAGHSLNLSLQTAPRRVKDALVFSASYLARIPGTPWLSLSANAIIQNSDFSTLGAFAIRGRGRIFGGRATFTLPSSAAFFQSLTAGLDSKNFAKEIVDDPNSSPIAYWPFTLQYGAILTGEASQSQLGVTMLVNLRGLGSAAEAFDARRFRATGSFATLRGELSRLQELPAGFQASGRLAAQYSRDALIPSEQITAGGAESVRGYLEAQAAGDAGFTGSLELRGPPLLPGLLRELRFHLFADGARVFIRDPLPEQDRIFRLWSAGAGMRVRVTDWLGGAFDLGVPLRSEGSTARYRVRGHFRMWGEF